MKTDDKKTSLRNLFGMAALSAVLIWAVTSLSPANAQQQQQQQQEHPNQPKIEWHDKAKHGDWTIRCTDGALPTVQKDTNGKGDLATSKSDKDGDAEADKKKESCAMLQFAPNVVNEKFVLQVAVVKLKAQGKEFRQLRVTVPNVVIPALPLGMGLQIDDDANSAQRMAYQMCPQGVCIVIHNLDDKLLGLLKAGSKTKLFLWDFQNRQAVFTLSLKGFTKAFESL